MRLGRITDCVGEVVSEPRAKEAGVVLYVRAVPSIDKGDTVASIGVAGKSPLTYRRQFTTTVSVGGFSVSGRRTTKLWPSGAAS